MDTPLNRVMNPTDEQRHEMLRAALENAGRTEDYEYIVNLLSPPPDIINYASPGELKGVKIGIIGGGLAGLSAAFELRKLGADITILEASEDRIGGRVYTHYFDNEGKYFAEFGAMRTPVTHEAVWHYVNLFGLETQSLASPRRNNFIYVHNTRLRSSDSIEEFLYPKYELTSKERATSWTDLNNYAFEYAYTNLPPEIRAEMISILPSYSPEYLPFMNMSVRQFLEALGLSQGAISLISGVNSPTGALLNISYDDIVHEGYTFDYMNTYRIKGGNVNLPLAFYQSFFSDSPPQYNNISKNLLGSVTYQPGCAVTGIYQSSYRNKIVLKYVNKREAKDLADIFDYVICALPFSALREIEIKPFFSNMKMQAILEYNYTDSEKTAFLCNRRFWEKNADYGNMIGGISYTDLPIQAIVYPGDHNACATETCSPEEPGVLLASYGLNQNATRLANLEPSRRYEVIRQNVEEVHGLPRGFLNSVVEEALTVHWFNEPNFRGAFTLALPGQKNRFAYEILQPEYNNRVFFAGEHTSAKHGWMQGALYTGKAAANNLAFQYHNQR